MLDNITRRLRGIPPYDSRTFIDRIHVRSSKFANWEPSFPIELGDYGTVDCETGSFDMIGNIFTDEATKTAAASLEIITGAEDESYFILSLETAQVGFSAGVNASVPGLTESRLKAQFKFTRDSEAVLLMHKPTTSRIVGNLDVPFPPDHYKHLHGMHLVTEVVTCHAYAMYLSGKKSETVTLALCGDASAAGLPVGAEISSYWYHEGTSGVFRCGAKTDQEYKALYNTKKIGKRNERRREFEDNQAPLGVDTWLDTTVPWNNLDDDDEEEPDYSPLESESEDEGS